MNRYTIREHKYESDSPMARLQELENKVEDRELVEAIHGLLVEERYGEWVKYPHNSGIYCSECRHKRRYRDIKDKYCPNCGAKMDGERKER